MAGKTALYAMFLLTISCSNKLGDIIESEETNVHNPEIVSMAAWPDKAYKNSTVTVTVSAKDGDGDTVTLSVSSPNGSVVLKEKTDEDTWAYTFTTDSSTGPYKVEVTATDSGGVSATDTLSIPFSRWQLVTESLTAKPRSGAFMATDDTNLYVVDGVQQTACTTVLKDGSNFSLSTSVLNTLRTIGLDYRTYGSTEIHGGYMYLIAGYNYYNGTTTNKDTVLKYTIPMYDGDGNIITPALWTTINPTNGFTGRYYHSSALYNDDIYVFGGFNSTSTEFEGQELWLFDTATEQWTNLSVSLSPAPTAERYLHASAIDSGIFYTFGGYAGEAQSDLTTIELSTRNSATVTTTFPGAGRYGHTMVSYNGKLYIFGGKVLSPAAGFVNDFYEYDISDNAWTQLESMPAARFLHSMVVTSTGVIYIYGGRNDTTKLHYDDLWAYHIE